MPLISGMTAALPASAATRSAQAASIPAGRIRRVLRKETASEAGSHTCRKGICGCLFVFADRCGNGCVILHKCQGDERKPLYLGESWVIMN